MRRVRTEDGNGAAAPAGDLGAQLGKLLNGLEDIKAVQSSVAEMQKDIKSMWARINRAEKLADKGEQYQKDHNELHRNMAKATGEERSDLQQQLAQMVAQHSATLQEAMQAQVNILTAAVTTLHSALEEFTDKKVDVNIGQPEQNITVEFPELPERRYKIVRGQNGLMDEIVERKA